MKISESTVVKTINGISNSSTSSVLPYPTSFSNIRAGVILPLSNNDTATDVEKKENEEKYFVLSSPNEANKVPPLGINLIDVLKKKEILM